MIGTGIGLFFGGLVLLACLIVFAAKRATKLGKNLAQAFFSQADRQAAGSASDMARAPLPGFNLKSVLLNSLPLLVLYVLSGAMALSGFIIFIVGVVKG